MMSNRSFFDVRLLRETMRRNIWAIALSLIGFAFCLPIPMAITLQNMLENAKRMPEDTEYIMKNAADTMGAWLSLDNFLITFGCIIMALLCGVAMFRYLHSRKQVDFYHGIPISRTKLFVTNYLTGVLSVLPALYLMYALAAIITLAAGVKLPFGFGKGLFVLLLHSLFFLLIYTISVLATVLTGNTIIAVLMVAWLLFSIPAAAGIAGALGTMYFHTWGGFGMLRWLVTYASPPILYVLTSTGDPLYVTGNALRIYNDMPVLCKILICVLIATILLFVLSLILFRKRKSECAGTAVAFQKLKAPLKCYMVLVIALLFGLVFTVIGGEFWVWFGLLAGTVLGHILIEMIYHFDFRAAFAHWKTMIILAAAAIAIVMGFQHDIFGYDKWLPKEASIQAVSFDSGFARSDIRGGISTRQKFLSARDNIAAIRKLAEISAAYTEERHDEWRYEDAYEYDADYRATFFSVSYKLPGGREASRYYSIPMTDETWALIDSVRFSEEYMRAINPIFEDYESKGSTRLCIRTQAEPSDAAGMIVTDQTVVKQLMDALREETLTLTAEIAKSTAPVLRIDLEHYDEDGDTDHALEYLPVYPSYVKTLSILKGQGIEPKALTADDIARVVVEWESYGDYEDAIEYPSTYQDPMVTHSTQPSTMPLETQEDGVTMTRSYAIITDKAKITGFLENAILEPVAYACDTGMDVTGWLRDDGKSHTENSEADYGQFTVSVAFMNNASCRLFYQRDDAPLELCKEYYEKSLEYSKR